MDPARFSTIGHGGMLLCNPLSSANVDLLVEALDLAPGARALDIGCGKGEILIRVAERWGAEGRGVDWSAEFLADARRLLSARGPGADVEFVEADATRFETEPASWDLCISVGSAWLLGGFSKALQTFQTWLRPGGLALVGEGYWKQPPSREYLRLLGAREDEFGTHEANIAAGSSLGLEPLFSSVASDADWDLYEWTYWSNIERWSRTNPDDPQRRQILERGRLGRDRYLRGGREALGFGLYLFRAG